MRVISFILFLFFLLPVQAQDYSALKKKARLLYSYKEYKMAIPLYDSLLYHEPDSIETIRELGNCYLNLRMPDKAIGYYMKCLEIDPHYPEAFYNLGSSYDMKGESKASVHFFREYLKYRQDPRVYNRLSNIYLEMEGKTDSAIFFAEKALEIQPDLPDSYFSISFAYITNSMYREGLHAALKGLEADSGYTLLYLPAGLASYYLDQYSEARDYFRKGWESEGYEDMFSIYYAQSIILANTHPGKFFKEGERLYFHDIKSKNLKHLVSETRNEKNVYYYPGLLRKLKDAPSSMSLDDFIMLYIGFTGDPSYNPYSRQSDEVFELWKNNNFPQFSEKAKNFLGKVPTQYPLYIYLAEMYKKQRDFHSQLDYLLLYYGFSESIKATGRGDSKEEAMIISFIDHEYDVMAELGLDVTGQSLLEDKSYYDMLTGLDSGNQVHHLYFNIDLPFSTLDVELKKKREERKIKN